MSTLLAHDEHRALDPATLESYRRDLTRALVSLLCTSTGRSRTSDEQARLDALGREIVRVRHELRRRA
jgi:hypothetical protein